MTVERAGTSQGKSGFRSSSGIDVKQEFERLPEVGSGVGSDRTVGSVEGGVCGERQKCEESIEE